MKDWFAKNGTSLRKWGARTVVSAAGLLTMWVSTGSWDTEETIGLITAISGALTSLLVPLDVKDKARRRRS